MAAWLHWVMWPCVFSAAALAGTVNPGAAQEAPAVPQGVVKEGHPAPDFTLKTQAGDRVRLSDLRGQPVLVNFWASWCKPCEAEMPHIVAAYDSLRDRGLNTNHGCNEPTNRIGRDLRADRSHRTH